MAYAPPREATGTETINAAPSAVPHVRAEGAAAWWRRAFWLLGIVIVVVIGYQLTPGFPSKWVINLTRPINAFENWTIDHRTTSWLWVDVLTPIKNGINDLFEQMVLGLQRMTWLGLIVAAGVISGIFAGWRMAVLGMAGFVAIGVLGLWVESIETFVLVLVSVIVSLVLGIPIGIWAGRRPRVDRALRPVMDAMQTIPAFSYLIPLVLFFSIGPTTGVIATVIFAIPAAIRLTSLGVKQVPPTSLEVADAFGSTSHQRLRKVQLPLAKPSIMLGVNQTIMFALGMIVIAAVVGVPGLGSEVYHALQGQHVGEAFNAGLAIVVLAVVLDRVTYAWSLRERRHPDLVRNVRIAGRMIPRWQAGIAGVVLIGIAVFIGRQVLRQQDFPSQWTTSVAAPVDRAVDWITSTIGGITSWITDVTVKYALDPLLSLLTQIPWWMICGAAAVLAWRVSRRWTLVVGSFACLAAIGFLGMWDQAMNTLSQVIVAVTISVALAIPLGIWSSRNKLVRGAMKPVLDTMQTMPQFVYLVPVVALFAPGRVPAVIAAVVYALPPAIRLTDLGIRQVPHDTVEAAQAYGTTGGQLLRKVQLPLAKPSIMLGVNQTVMMVLSVVIIGALVGGAGLGLEVYQGLTHDELAQGLVGGFCILLLAIVVDRITQEMGTEQRTMRGPVGGSFGFWTWIRSIRVWNGEGSVPRKGDA